VKRNRKKEIPVQDVLKRQKIGPDSKLEAYSFEKIKEEILKEQLDDKALLKLLRKADKKVFQITDAEGDTLLHWAIDTGQEEIIEALVKKDRKSILVKDGAGKTPLYWALERGQSDIVELLLNNIGSDLNFAATY
jgi:ankyrin repeat protein